MQEIQIRLTPGLAARVKGIPQQFLDETCANALRVALGYDQEWLDTHLDARVDAPMPVTLGSPLGESTVDAIPIARDHQGGANGLGMFLLTDGSLALTDDDGWTLGTYDDLGQAAQHGCASIDLLVQAAERLGVDLTVTTDPGPDAAP